MNARLSLPRLVSLPFRLWALLLLAIIGLQAAQPFTAPHERQHGPAFNAATVEVALTTQRRTDIVRAAMPFTPALPPATHPQRASAVPVLATRPTPRPDSTGPPARAILIRQPAPRAPPLP